MGLPKNSEGQIIFRYFFKEFKIIDYKRGVWLGKVKGYCVPFAKDDEEYYYATLTKRGRKFYPYEDFCSPPFDKCDSLESVCATFYVLQELKELTLKSKIPVCYRKWINWRRELEEFEENFVKKLARSLRDTLAWMCFDELKWAPHTKVYRDDMAAIEELDLSELKAAKKLYEENFWVQGWGFRPWANITRMCFTYEHRPPRLFIDSVFGLVHNGGCAFDRKKIITARRRTLFSFLLDFRQGKSILFDRVGERDKDWPSCTWPYELDTRVYYLLLDAVKMRLVDRVYFPKQDILEDFMPAGRLKLKRIDWGKKKLDPMVYSIIK